MIFSLWIFLLIWLALVGIFALLSAISVVQMWRYGLVGVGTYASILFFLIVSGLALLSTGGYFLTVDWMSSVSVFGASVDAPMDYSL